jgi:hypothetical protein
MRDNLPTVSVRIRPSFFATWEIIPGNGTEQAPPSNADEVVASFISSLYCGNMRKPGRETGTDHVFARKLPVLAVRMLVVRVGVMNVLVAHRSMSVPV